jgi:uncharacterized protein
MVKVVIFKKLNLKNPTVMIGFQGVGLVGSLAAGYLTDKLNLKQVGYVETTAIAPVAMIVATEIRFPIRIFADEKENVVLFESELPIPPKHVNEIAGEIVNWAKGMGTKRIVCMEGIGSAKPPKAEKVLGVGNSPDEDGYLKKNKVELLKNGIIVGLSAVILLKAKADKVPAVCLMSEAHSQYPDGKAAATIIKTLNTLHGWNIDTKDLIDKASKFEDKIKSVIKKVKAAGKDDVKPEHLYG